MTLERKSACVYIMASTTAMHIVTPVIESRVLSHLLKKRVYLKLDNTQPSGSFKLRGVGLACERAVQKGAEQLVASSGGNAGLAVACSAQKLGVPGTVFVPESTPAYMRERLALEGLHVNVHGKVWAEAHEAAMQFLDKANETSSAAYIHPFDHADIVEGHASVVTELKAQLPTQPDLVVVAVGGGGYFAGVCQGLKNHGWDSTHVLAMETTGANKLERSMQAKKKVALTKIDTIAKSLGAMAVSDTAYAYANEMRVHACSVSDAEALDACVRFANDHKYVVEPACGTALAPLYTGRLREFLGADLDAIDSICVLVCGGWMTQVTDDAQVALRAVFG
ncbi:hypothetical protein H310_00468 [Aphanomyces invadans]|uniref:L-serine ammonia-lyase n=1 Tax=Aphanomyces invadans TaxID=157072 RepID=A0A024UVX5_9STRA|nr:hypothetical protein H310_00468 [Aphanomyces invadans]ETW10082.1 hypothetical protein H310_00468 [Aphanomyces invadans]|eukprot:XP_008861493.1 hypothetical protein H310_00468 [Aphanomyces invadans]